MAITDLFASGNSGPEIAGNQEKDGCIAGKCEVISIFEYTGNFTQAFSIAIRISPWLSSETTPSPDANSNTANYGIYSISAYAIQGPNANTWIPMAWYMPNFEYNDIGLVEIYHDDTAQLLKIRYKGVNINDLQGFNFGTWQRPVAPLMLDSINNQQELSNTFNDVYKSNGKYFRCDIILVDRITSPVFTDNYYPASVTWEHQLRFYNSELGGADSANLIEPEFELIRDGNPVQNINVNKDTFVKFRIKRAAALAACDLTAGTNQCEVMIFRKANADSGVNWRDAIQAGAFDPNTGLPSYAFHGILNLGLLSGPIWDSPRSGIAYLGNDVYEVTATIRAGQLASGFEYQLVQIWTLDNGCLPNGLHGAPQRYSFVSETVETVDEIEIIAPEIIESGFDTVTANLGSTAMLASLERSELKLRLDTSSYDNDPKRLINLQQAIRSIRFRIMRNAGINESIVVQDLKVNKNTGFQSLGIGYGTDIDVNSGEVYIYYRFRVRNDSQYQALYEINSGNETATDGNQDWTGSFYADVELELQNQRADNNQLIGDLIRYRLTFLVNPQDGTIESGTDILKPTLTDGSGNALEIQCSTLSPTDAKLCFTHADEQQDTNFESGTNVAESIAALNSLSTGLGDGVANQATCISDVQAGNGLIACDLSWITANDSAFDPTSNTACFTIDRDSDAYLVNGINKTGIIRHNSGLAMKFDKTNREHFITPHYEEMELGCSAVTWEAWVRPASFPSSGGTYQVIMSKRREGTDACDSCYGFYGAGPFWVLGMGIGSGGMGIVRFTHRHRWDTQFLQIYSGNCLTINQWNHIVLTRIEDGYRLADYRLYVNGVLQGLSATHNALSASQCDLFTAKDSAGVIQDDINGVPLTCNGPLVVGGLYTCESLGYGQLGGFTSGLTLETYNGYMRAVRIYKRQLDIGEATANFARGWKHGRPEDSRELVFDFISNSLSPTSLINRANSMQPQNVFAAIRNVATSAVDCSITSPLSYGLPLSNNPFYLI